MVEILLEGYEMYLMGIICLLGIFGTWKAGRQYRRLISQAENMMSTGHPFLLQIKNRFENTYRVNTGINNIKAFVWKNAGECKCMGIRLNHLGNAAGHMGILCMVLGLAFTIFKYWYANESLKTSLFSLAVGMVLGLLDFWVLYRTDVISLEERLMIHLQEYLENTMVNRLKNAREDERYLSREDERHLSRADTLRKDIPDRQVKKEKLERLKKENEETYQDEFSYLKESFQTIASDREDDLEEEKHKMTRKEEQLIDDILKDYFH